MRWTPCLKLPLSSTVVSWWISNWIINMTVWVCYSSSETRPVGGHSAERGRKVGTCVCIHTCLSLLELSDRECWRVCLSEVHGRERGECSADRQTEVKKSERLAGQHSWNIRLSVCACVSIWTCVFVCVWVFQTGSLSLEQDIHTQQAGMREREELRRAIEQSDRLLSRVRELEEQNSQLNKEKNEVATKYRAVSLLLCSVASLSLLQLLFSRIFL